MDRQLDEALKVLAIPVDSDPETVTSAYRRLARATHPDVSPDPDAAEQFATVTAAYRLVSAVPRPRFTLGNTPRTARQRRARSCVRPHPERMPTSPRASRTTGRGRPRTPVVPASFLRCHRSGRPGRGVARPSWLGR